MITSCIEIYMIYENSLLTVPWKKIYVLALQMYTVWNVKPYMASQTLKREKFDSRSKEENTVLTPDWIWESYMDTSSGYKGPAVGE